MNIRLHQAILAALAVGTAGTASAIDITTVPAANILYTGGSTAVDAAFKLYFYNTTDTTTLCKNDGLVDLYVQNTGAPSKFFAVACNSNPALVNDGSGNSVPIAVIKEDNAGSFNGVGGVLNVTFSGSPFTTGGALLYPVISALTTSNCPGSTVSGTNVQTITSRKCTGFTTTGVVPNLGFADVEGTLWGFDTSTLTSGPTVQIVFAPAVSLGLYHALQAEQGLTVGAEGVANMPSLTTGQLSAMYSGQAPATGWAGIKNATGTAVSAQSVPFGNSTGSCWNGTSLQAACTTPPNATAASSTIYVCRRGHNSGTQISAEIYFNDYNCGTNTYPISNPSLGECSTESTDGCSWVQSSYASKTVFAGNGTGDLLDCLQGQDQAGHFAVGYASVDNGSGGDQSTTTRKDFRYVKLDDVVPSIENAAAGRYKFVAQSFWYAPPATASNAATGIAATIATVLENTNGTNDGIGSVGSVAGVASASHWTTQGFDGGVLVIPGNNGAAPSSASATQATFLANPVSMYWKTKGTTNNCVRYIPYNLATEIAVDGNAAWAGP